MAGLARGGGRRRGGTRARYLMARAASSAATGAAGRHPRAGCRRPTSTRSPQDQERTGSRATSTSSGASAPTSAGTPRSWSSGPTRPPTASAGHLATFASSPPLYEVGFNHFFRGKDDGLPGDHVYFQGHAAPGIYARAFLEGRLDEEPPRPLPPRDRRRRPLQLPPPAADARLLGVPDGLDGPGPDQSIYQARFNRYLHTAASTTPPRAGCGASSATARPTSPRRSGPSRWPPGSGSTT